MSASSRRVYIRVSGRVHGVGFRYAALIEARRLGLAGWVRNVPDGTVELVAEGLPSAVQSLIAWCEHGPPSARVAGTVVREEPNAAPLVGFEIR
jgi:acylphosphatase